jgi:hypothetical protein
MMFIVFLPTVVGCKTTLIIYGPKKWGHARGTIYFGGHAFAHIKILTVKS